MNKLYLRESLILQSGDINVTVTIALLGELEGRTFKILRFIVPDKIDSDSCPYIEYEEIKSNE